MYSALYCISDKGKDIRIVQYVFAELYVITLAMVFAIYHRCASVSTCLDSERYLLILYVGTTLCTDPGDIVEATALDLRPSPLQRRDSDGVLLRCSPSMDEQEAIHHSGEHTIQVSRLLVLPSRII